MKPTCAPILAAAVAGAVALSGCTAAKDPAKGSGDGTAAGATTAASADSAASGGATTGSAALADTVRGIEQQHAGTAGVYAIDTETGRSVGYREGERFGFASTYKVLAAAAVLAKLDRGGSGGSNDSGFDGSGDFGGSGDGLDRKVAVMRADIAPNSPVLGKSAGKPVKLRAIIRAAVTRSDNTAGNVLIRLLGGPATMQRALRAMGDEITHVDHDEPALNDWKPGKKADSTTPEQAATDLRAAFQGGTLTAAQQKVLWDCMRASTTGDKRIRAAVKALGSGANGSGGSSTAGGAGDSTAAAGGAIDTTGWTVGGKTGTSGASGQAGVHDIARIDRPGAGPIFIAVYTYKRDLAGASSANADEAFVSQTAQAALRALNP